MVTVVPVYIDYAFFVRLPFCLVGCVQPEQTTTEPLIGDVAAGMAVLPPGELALPPAKPPPELPSISPPHTPPPSPPGSMLPNEDAVMETEPGLQFAVAMDTSSQNSEAEKEEVGQIAYPIGSE